MLGNGSSTTSSSPTSRNKFARAKPSAWSTGARRLVGVVTGVAALAEMARVTVSGGALFVRDLLRPENDAAVRHLVRQYAGGANTHQRQMFEDSLRAALTLEEVRALVVPLGFDLATVKQTSDRHWTWTAKTRG